MLKLSITLVALSSIASVNGHGMLTKPISRALREATRNADGYGFAGTCPHHACEWYTQHTPAIGETSNCDPKLRTMGVACANKGDRVDWPCKQKAPWCRPGSAAVNSPCGVFSGGYGVVGAARDMLDLSDTPQDTWVMGGTAKIAWSIIANHGGGYAFRICKKGSNMSEACFQAGHLEFATTNQTVVDGSGKVLTTYPAVRTRNGTTPYNSSWTRNPFPQEENLPGIPGLNLSGRGPFILSVQDTVAVPENIDPGHYVLSWRWDAEQTKQVWSHCSDVNIVKKGQTPPPPAPAPSGNGHNVCTGGSIGLSVPECDAWGEVYDSLGGDGWPASWSQGCDSMRTDPCGCNHTWQKSIKCSSFRDYMHITEIYMLGSNLTGTIPAALTKFPELAALSLVDSEITGGLPENIGDLSKLSMIWLDHNKHLSGPLPQSMTKLPLQVIEVHRTNFSGALPPLNYTGIPDCTLNDLVFSCPLPAGADTCGALCK